MNILLSFGADILVILASLGAMAYCIVLSRRLSRLTSFDKGLGSAIAVMSSQVDEMKSALREAKAGSDGAGKQLNELVHQARDISTELEMMIAACHDFAEEAIEVQGGSHAPGSEFVAAEEMDTAATFEEASDPPEEAEPEAVFGSRRAAADRGDPKAAASVEPLFRHREVAAG